MMGIRKRGSRRSPNAPVCCWPGQHSVDPTPVTKLLMAWACGHSTGLSPFAPTCAGHLIDVERDEGTARVPTPCLECGVVSSVSVWAREAAR